MLAHHKQTLCEPQYHPVLLPPEEVVRRGFVQVLQVRRGLVCRHHHRHAVTLLLVGASTPLRGAEFELLISDALDFVLHPADPRHVPDVVQDNVNVAYAIELPQGVRPMLRVPDPKGQRRGPQLSCLRRPVRGLLGVGASSPPGGGEKRDFNKNQNNFVELSPPPPFRTRARRSREALEAFDA